MLEQERIQRNQSHLLELYPSIRSCVQAVLQEMESAGYRPRIQEAWRSAEDQLKAYNAGTSKVKYGFHNVTARNGTKEALAADIIDDNRPFNTKTAPFTMRLCLRHLGANSTRSQKSPPK